MKILMLLSNPFMVDPRVHNEAKALVDEGNEVAVVVWDRKGEYGQEDVVDGIRIVRIHNTGLMKVMPNDLFRNPIWWRTAYKKGLELHKGGFDFDTVHCHDLDTLQPGVWLKRKIGCKIVYDAHEIFGYMIEGNVPRVVSKQAFRMEKRLLRWADHVITVNKLFQEYFTSLTDKPITIVMNCKDLVYNEYAPPDNDMFTLIYIGLMTKGRFFPQVINLVNEIKGVRLIVGGKKEGIYDEVERVCAKYQEAEFVGTIPSSEILPRTRMADATFILIDPSNSNSRTTVFNKQFEAMVCGRPIILTKDTYAGRMTEELDCGLTVAYNADAIKKAIEELRDNPSLREKLGRNAFRAAKERYNWEMEKRNLLKVYEEIK